MTEDYVVAILTKSSKRRSDDSYGCCLAGVGEEGAWVRFVADASGDSLPKDICIDTRQVISAKGIRAPLKYQTENVILNDFRIINARCADYVKKLYQEKEYGIFGNTKNHLTKTEMERNKGTLRLIEVQDINVYWNSCEKCRANFCRNGIVYDDMPMTDPYHYTKKGSPPMSLGDAFIVVSISEYPPFNKFVAAIYPKKQPLGVKA